MREIKFRAWVNAWNGPRMENNWLEIMRDGSPYGKCNDTIWVDILSMMQFTGLKDKNGVEIYEGDILMADVANPHPDRVLGPVVVKYSISTEGRPSGHGERNEDLVAGFKITNYYDKPENMIVAGNIYQHPELLK